MKITRTIAAGVGSLLLFAALALPAVAQTSPAPPPAPPPAPGQGNWKNHEHHPEIHRALRKLEKAEQDLGNASHDFGGHRAKAMQLIHQAEQELQQALQYDEH